jgi:hypothetical protein
MKRILYIFLFLGPKLFSQDIDIALDTLVSANIEVYCNQYTLRNSKEPGGEAWEIRKDKVLNHTIYRDAPSSPFPRAGQWTFMNDSIIFFIMNKNLLKKHGHNYKESFKPFTISMSFKSKTKNPSDSAQVMVYKNQIIILNNVPDLNTLFMEMKMYLHSRIEPIKSKLDPTLKWYYTELNENLKVELGDFLFQKKLFSSITSTRNFE